MARTRDIWRMVDLALAHSNKTLLYGPPGTGKTTVGVKAGNPNKVYKVTLHEESSVADLMGHFIPKDGQFVWHDGIAVRAWKEGARLVIDEVNEASGEVLTFLYAILDDAEVAQLTLPSGETVYPRAGFSCVATMNGDPRDLPDALRDRFFTVVEVTEVAPQAIEALPEDLRNAAKAGQSDLATTDTTSTSVRSWKAFAELRKSMDTLDAAILVFGDRAEEVVDSLSVAAAE